MAEEVIIQTADEVANIDYMMKTNDMINKQADEMQNNIDTITEQLDIIIDNTNNTIGATTSEYIETDLSAVTDLIENIDTSLMEANTQDILVKMNKQQEQINDINEKLDLILSKL